MPSSFFSFIKKIDATLFLAIAAIACAGLFTMSSFQGDDTYFWKQGIWITVALFTYLVASLFEYRFLKQTKIVLILYGFLLFILSLLFTVGYISKGAESWFRFGGIAFQPTDLRLSLLDRFLPRPLPPRRSSRAGCRYQ